MEQMTSEEAIAFGKSGEWHDYTSEQIFLLQIEQRKVCVPWRRFLEAATAVLGRPVWTHEFGDPQSLLDEWAGTIPKPTMDDVIRKLEERVGKSRVIVISTHEKKED